MVRILLAEDNKDVADLIAEILEVEGHQVEVVSNGLLALDLLKSGSEFDVVITDLIMPVLDGIGVLRYVLAQKKAIPVIVLSGGGVTIGSQDALRVVDGMASAVLQKPIVSDELIQAVASVAA